MCNNNTVLFMDQLVSLKCFVGVPALLCFIFFPLHLDCLETCIYDFTKGDKCSFVMKNRDNLLRWKCNPLHEKDGRNEHIKSFYLCISDPYVHTAPKYSKRRMLCGHCPVFKIFFFLNWVNDFHLNCSTTTQCCGFRYDSLWFHSHTSLEVTI